MKYFENISDGERLQCGPVHMTETSIIEFARQFDPQPFHIDRVAGKNSVFCGIVASSLHTLSACTRVVVDALGDVTILSGVGMDEVKMTNPVRPGDILTVNAWWTKLKRSESKPDFGFGTVECQVVNQNNEPIMNYGYQYLIASKSKEQKDKIIGNANM